jgi:hypothetical protein
MKRRDLLKWTTPVVAAVVLPAHAMTTDLPPGGGDICDFIDCDGDRETLIEKYCRENPESFVCKSPFE